jgi:hypothetical protein
MARCLRIGARSTSRDLSWDRSNFHFPLLPTRIRSYTVTAAPRAPSRSKHSDMVNKKREREEVVQNGEGVLEHPPLKRAKEIDAHPPLKELQDTLQALKGADTVKTVVHWFRSKDLRQEDNKALAAASALAQKHDAVLLTVFLFSPGDLRWHGVRVASSLVQS